MTQQRNETMIETESRWAVLKAKILKLTRAQRDRGIRSNLVCSALLPSLKLPSGDCQ